MEDSFQNIPVKTIDGKEIILTLFPETENSLWVIPVEEAEEYGEVSVQLKEECSYEYKLPENYHLEEILGVIKPSKINRRSGRILPGIYVGTLSLEILDDNSEKKASIEFEVRSSKTSYREDYRHMLEYITERCTDLVMQHTSPVTQHFEPDYEADPQTLYQRFAFIKSIIDTPEFQESIQRVLRSPVTAWKIFEEETDIRAVKHIRRSVMRQIASCRRRTDIPAGHSLSSRISTFPEKLVVSKKNETADTPENRFVKYALTVFYHFCSNIRHRFEDNTRAYKEALHLEEMLESVLGHSLFKEISKPETLPLNSPVLQRKEGYREILRVWLIFDLAARLIWRGGEDVYEAGKRDVAMLYEYWLFFRILELFSEIFKISPDSTDNLLEPTPDGIGLKLKSGRYTPFQGVYDSGSRKLNIVFNYNKTFSGEKSYPSAGSWTRTMRPDYTLSIWPIGFTESQAEEQELIVHIHFDAKYKVNDLSELFGEAEENLEEEKLGQRRGTYKRADLLKMHAYKDAVRRTGGAYVLYPGTEPFVKTGFHEIIPGLGAFPIRPSRQNSGVLELRQFILDILEHFLNRTSQHERMTFHTFKIHENKSVLKIKEPIPEYSGDTRFIPPEEVSVLIGFCKSGVHFEWINKNGMYNARASSDRGSLRLSPEEAGAAYLLLHGQGQLITGDIWKIIKRGPRVFSKAKLLELDYPDPNQEYYLMYDIKKPTADEFEGAKWDIRRLKGYKTGQASALPFAVSLAQLMLAKVRN